MKGMALVIPLCVVGLFAPGSARPFAGAAQLTARAAAQACPGGPSGSFTLDGVTVTVSAARRDHGGQSDMVKPGMIFQDIHLRIANHGKYHYAYNALDFALLDSGARDYGEQGDFNSNLAQHIDTGTLGPGQSVSGDIAFIVPDATRPAALRWTPTGLGLNDPHANLNITDYLIRLPGYSGHAGPCPAGPTGTVTAAGVTLTVGKLTPVNDTGVTPLKPGYAFRVLHVTLVNHGRYHYDYNPDDFTAMDPGARLYGQATPFDNNLAQPIDMGKLGPGQRLSGELAFALPVTLKIVAIRWQPSGLGLDDPTHPRVGDYNVRLP